MPALIPSGVDFCFSEFQADFLSKFDGLKRHVTEFPSEYQDDENNKKSVLDTFLECGIFPTYSFPKDVVGFYVENGKGSEIVQKPERSLDTAIRPHISLAVYIASILNLDQMNKNIRQDHFLIVLSISNPSITAATERATGWA